MINTILWNLTELSFNFSLSPRTAILFDQVSVDKRDLSEEPLPLVSLVKTTKLPDKEEIIEILMEDASLWLVTHSA